MISITRAEKTYFIAVGVLALWVGLWGYFLPALVDWAIPWLVPPLHARFLGSMYLSGAAFMAGCLLTRRYLEVRVVMPMIALWTGMLFLISLFYLDEFNYTVPTTYIWFIAYLIYPLIAIQLMWKHRADQDQAQGRPLAGWAKSYLLVQGIVVTLLALALLLLTNRMVASWPWTITPLLAQIYSAPFLSYGIGSLLLSQQRTWAEVRIALGALLVFAVGVLLASIIHRNLFSAAELPDLLWFGGFSLAALFLGLLTFHASRIDQRNGIEPHQTMEEAS